MLPMKAEDMRAATSWCGEEAGLFEERERADD